MKPELLVSNERWSRTPYVVFENENLEAILGEWADEKYRYDETNASREEIFSEMKMDFYNENENIKRIWPHWKLILTDNGDFYSYDDNGVAIFLRHIK